MLIEFCETMNSQPMKTACQRKSEAFHFRSSKCGGVGINERPASGSFHQQQPQRIERRFPWAGQAYICSALPTFWEKTIACWPSELRLLRQIEFSLATQWELTSAMVVLATPMLLNRLKRGVA